MYHLDPSLLSSDNYRLVRSVLLFISITASVELVAASPSEAVSHTAHSTMLSTRIATAIRASLPNYDPPPKTESIAPDPTDTASIIFMDPMVITDKRLSATPWDMLSAAGKADYLKKRYRGATMRGDPLTQSTFNFALMMQHEEVRLQSLKKLDELVEITRLKDDPMENKKLQKEMTRARMRPNDSLTEAMDKSFNRYLQ